MNKILKYSIFFLLGILSYLYLKKQVLNEGFNFYPGDGTPVESFYLSLSLPPFDVDDNTDSRPNTILYFYGLHILPIKDIKLKKLNDQDTLTKINSKLINNIEGLTGNRFPNKDLYYYINESSNYLKNYTVIFTLDHSLDGEYDPGDLSKRMINIDIYYGYNKEKYLNKMDFCFLDCSGSYNDNFVRNKCLQCHDSSYSEKLTDEDIIDIRIKREHVGAIDRTQTVQRAKYSTYNGDQTINRAPHPIPYGTPLNDEEELIIGKLKISTEKSSEQILKDEKNAITLAGRIIGLNETGNYDNFGCSNYKCNNSPETNFKIKGNPTNIEEFKTCKNVSNYEGYSLENKCSNEICCDDLRCGNFFKNSDDNEDDKTLCSNGRVNTNKRCNSNENCNIESVCCITESDIGCNNFNCGDFDKKNPNENANYTNCNSPDNPPDYPVCSQNLCCKSNTCGNGVLTDKDCEEDIYTGDKLIIDKPCGVYGPEGVCTTNNCCSPKGNTEFYDEILEFKRNPELFIPCVTSTHDLSVDCEDLEEPVVQTINTIQSINIYDGLIQAWSEESDHITGKDIRNFLYFNLLDLQQMHENINGYINNIMLSYAVVYDDAFESLHGHNNVNIISKWPFIMELGLQGQDQRHTPIIHYEDFDILSDWFNNIDINSDLTFIKLNSEFESILSNPDSNLDSIWTGSGRDQILTKPFVLTRFLNSLKNIDPNISSDIDHINEINPEVFINNIKKFIILLDNPRNDKIYNGLKPLDYFLNTFSDQNKSTSIDKEVFNSIL